VEKQYSLCLKVLRRLKEAGVLDEMMVIGSWCIYFYKNYFTEADYTSSIRTRDIDFLIPRRLKRKSHIDLPVLFEDLGFVVDLSRKGAFRLVHPELIIDFVVSEKGKGDVRPFPIPQLGLNAQKLRFLEILLENPMKIEVDDFTITLPHPAAFALHKLIISWRRPKEEKRLKERREGIRILNSLITKGETDRIIDIFNRFPRRWKSSILRALEISEATDLINMFSRVK
jgi:hypothetical protein